MGDKNTIKSKTSQFFKKGNTPATKNSPAAATRLNSTPTQPTNNTPLSLPSPPNTHVNKSTIITMPILTTLQDLNDERILNQRKEQLMKELLEVEKKLAEKDAAKLEMAKIVVQNCEKAHEMRQKKNEEFLHKLNEIRSNEQSNGEPPAKVARK